MTQLRIVARVCSAFLLLCAAALPAVADQEMRRLTAQLLATPKIKTEPGFVAKVLVAPGELYDPQGMLPHGDAVWINDDGGEEGDKGGRVVAVDRQGKVSVVIGVGKLLPPTGFDIAPHSFGEFEGQIFTLAQARVGAAGALANHIIQRIDPSQGYATSVFCTLPSAGSLNEGTAGFGADARFGPEGSPFAGKFFAVTSYNNTIYQVAPDGTCTPFVIFDPGQWGTPSLSLESGDSGVAGLRFSPDGGLLLVSIGRAGNQGVIVQVRPDGTIIDQPMAEGLQAPVGMDYAPPHFGWSGSQLFVADVGDFQAPVPMTQALKADGKIYRVTRVGQLKLVASGFINPVGVRFVGNKLWVTDIGGDFISGMRELPDGFIVEIEAK